MGNLFIFLNKPPILIARIRKQVKTMFDRIGSKNLKERGPNAQKVISIWSYFHLKLLSFEVIIIWSYYHLKLFPFEVISIWSYFHLKLFPLEFISIWSYSFKLFSFEVISIWSYFHLMFFFHWARGTSTEHSSFELYVLSEENKYK